MDGYPPEDSLSDLRSRKFLEIGQGGNKDKEDASGNPGLWPLWSLIDPTKHIWV